MRSSTMAQEQPSAVRFFTSDHPALAQTVRWRLEKMRAQYIEQIGAGSAQDWGDYKHRAGVINGLDQAIQVCITIDGEMRKADR